MNTKLLTLASGLLVALLPLMVGLWLVRMNFWPRVQVRVLKTWEEVAGDDDGSPTGWLHADIEYWHQSKKYAVRWRGDLMSHRFLPDAVWMVLDPAKPDQARMPARWEMSAVFFLMALICGGSALYGFLK